MLEVLTAQLVKHVLKIVEKRILIIKLLQDRQFLIRFLDALMLLKRKK